jgi:hypothetical protein
VIFDYSHLSHLILWGRVEVERNFCIHADSLFVYGMDRTPMLLQSKILSVKGAEKLLK